jgi:hypothetical protein
MGEIIYLPTFPRFRQKICVGCVGEVLVDAGLFLNISWDVCIVEYIVWCFVLATTE